MKRFSSIYILFYTQLGDREYARNENNPFLNVSVLLHRATYFHSILSVLLDAFIRRIKRSPVIQSCSLSFLFFFFMSARANKAPIRPNVTPYIRFGLPTGNIHIAPLAPPVTAPPCRLCGNIRQVLDRA